MDVVNRSRVQTLVCLFALVASSLAAQVVKLGQIGTASGITALDNSCSADPSVIYDQGRYRLWFTHPVIHSDGVTGHSEFGYTESTDLITWSNPRRRVFGPGVWDAVGVETACVLRDPRNGALLLYYTGHRPSGGGVYSAIGLAKSTNNGETWVRRATPVLTELNGWELPVLCDLDGNSTTPMVPVGGVLEPSVLFFNGKFRMWYVGAGELDGILTFRIGYAESTDGINWTRWPEPVLDIGNPGNWDDVVVSHVNVIRDGNRFRMFYFGSSLWQSMYCDSIGGVQQMPGYIGTAVSSDGIHWDRWPDPILWGDDYTFDAGTVGGPCGLIRNSQMLLWYMGGFNLKDLDMRIGIAAVQLP